MLISIYPWELKLNGEVTWEGEEGTNIGIISVKDNLIRVDNMKYPSPSVYTLDKDLNLCLEQARETVSALSVLIIRGKAL